MFTLWLIIAIVLFAVGTYSIGRFDVGNGDPAGAIWTCFLGSLFWPILLAAAVIVGPFFGFFWLGDRKREKLEKEKSTDNK
jgi:hypothetical protein